MGSKQVHTHQERNVGAFHQHRLARPLWTLGDSPTRRVVTTTNLNEALNASQYSVFFDPMQKWYAPRTHLGRVSLFRLPIR